MAKKIKLKVTIEMSKNILKKQKLTILNNALLALVNHVENSEQGLSGSEFEGFTTYIKIEHDGLSIYKNLY
jgi:hypothetical protein